MNFHPEALREAIRYAVAFQSAAALAASTAETVFAAASNTGGAVVYRFAAFSRYASIGYPCIRLIAHTSAPGTISTGDTLGQQTFWAINGTDCMTGVDGLNCAAIYVPAGKGAYWINDSAEALGRRFTLYSLLT